MPVEKINFEIFYRNTQNVRGNISLSKVDENGVNCWYLKKILLRDSLDFLVFMCHA